MMKKIFVLIFLFLIGYVIIAQPTYNYQKRFQIKSGHVEYKLTGMIEGTKSLWWDDFGEKYSEEISTQETVKTGKRTEIVKNHSLSIADSKYFYNVNMATMKGTKISKDAVPDFSLLGSGLNDNEMEQLGEGLLDMFGGKVEKKSENVLGRICDVTKAMGSTIHSYKGITLRSNSQIASYENSEEAIKFEENIKISASKFQPPRNATLEDVSEQMAGENSIYGGLNDETDDEDDEQGLFFPSGIEFEKFKSESERIRRKMGYTFAMHDASSGQYSSMWTKKLISSIGVVVYSLRNYANWREDFADDGIEYFTDSGHRMAYRSDIFTDEESGTTTPGSILLIELKSKDAFMHITSTPEKTKQELISIFKQFNF